MLRYKLFCIYVIASLIIGEFHPFSSYKMYDSFPKSAHTFSLIDANGSVIPLQKYFNYKTADLSHNYCTIESSLSRDATQNLDAAIGAKLYSQLSEYQLREFETDTVLLQRIKLFFENGALMKQSTLLYEYIK